MCIRDRRELDRMEFYVYETRQLIKARHRPVVFITSNNEKAVSYTHLRAHETVLDLVCRLLLEKKKTS